uniref:DNA binding protein n=1 Tax=Arundo donax TaxID=35708 RepID=A0A0A9GD18_ARUDO
MENERTAINKMHMHSSNASRKNEGLGQQSININQQKNGTSIRHCENITNSAQRTPEGLVSASTMEKERVKVARPPPNTESAPRKEGMGQRISNISILLQKRNENTNKEIAKKEVGTTSPLLPNPANAMHKGNGKVGRPMDNTPTSMQRFDSPSTSSTSPAAGLDRGIHRPTIPSPSFTIRRPNGMVRPPEILPVSAKKPDTGGLSPAMGKEKEQGGRMLQTNVSIDQKLVLSKPPTVEKAADGRVERMEKVKDGAPGAAKKEDKKSDRHEKKKRKEKDKHKEKKKEKEAKKEKAEHDHREHDNKLRENSIIYPIDSLHMKPSAPPLAPPVDDGKAILPDENLKKRKNHEMNGYLQNHHDMRPTKLLRPALSNNRVENGTSSHVAAQLSSVKPEAMNIEKAERFHKKVEKINGNQEAQRSSVDSGPRDPVVAYENGTPSRKSPHPDCKYLSQIHSIPEAPQMTEWSEHDGEDWLFDQGSTQSRKPDSEPEADGVPQVWAQSLKIDPADVIALPYVIPF